MIYQIKITYTVKLFADDTSLFSVANDPNISVNELLNKDLELISERDTNGKCILILTRVNRHKKSFSHENNLNQTHLRLLLNKTPVVYSFSQKRLGIISDEKLNFTNHIKVKIQKGGIELMLFKV